MTNFDLLQISLNLTLTYIPYRSYCYLKRERESGRGRHGLEYKSDSLLDSPSRTRAFSAAALERAAVEVTI